MGTNDEQLASSATSDGRKIRGVAMAVVAVLALLEAGLVGFVLRGCANSPARESIADKVMKAWASGDPDDIADVYDVSVVMIFDGDQRASNRDEITSVIKSDIALPNTYERVGPVGQYELSDGDIFVASLVKVVGPAHPDGTPLIGFYRVRDGKVILHVFIDAQRY